VIPTVGRPHRAGQSLVEFALVLPIFLLLLFGLIDIGRYVYTANALNEAAREGARYGSVAGGTSGCSGGREACVKKVTLSRLAGVTGTLPPTVNCTRSTAGVWSNPSVASCRSNDYLGVTVQADFQVLTPIIGQFIGKHRLTGYAQVTVNQ
jgi:Flp pilus assembly protein TadG